MKKIKTFDQKIRRKRRVGKKIKGTAQRPRLSVFRSNHYIYAQVIDDEKRITLDQFSDLNLRLDLKKDKKSKTERAKLVGLKLSEKLKKAGIKELVFDRGFYKYHGRVAAVADGLREGEIKI